MRKLAVLAMITLAVYLIARHPGSLGTFVHTYTHSRRHHR